MRTRGWSGRDGVDVRRGRIRLDLLRLHGSVTDLTPCETIMHDARLLTEDLSRLAEAHRDVEVGDAGTPAVGPVQSLPYRRGPQSEQILWLKVASDRLEM